MLDAGEKITPELVEFEEFVDMVISWTIDEPFLAKWLLEKHYRDGSWERVKKMMVG